MVMSAQNRAALIVVNVRGIVFMASGLQFIIAWWMYRERVSGKNMTWIARRSEDSHICSWMATFPEE